ncbi:hypothetical protein WJX72_008500 [[Myrmecia] bisecta]|uniref:Uncharacterized protein n=1 Tax=[Myrmecia] bisecta TaxID=41462 RepID=A0AAW1R7E6_9CHLO
MLARSALVKLAHAPASLQAAATMKGSLIVLLLCALGVALLQGAAAECCGGMSAGTGVCFPANATTCSYGGDVGVTSMTTYQPDGVCQDCDAITTVYIQFFDTYTAQAGPNCKCVAPGAAGDPLVTGFNGRLFDFSGAPGKYFSMISEQAHQLNVKMVDAGFRDAAHPNGGVYMGELGFLYRDHSVVAQVDEAGDMTVTVDGKLLAKERFYQAWLDGEATVEVEPHFPELGHVVVISTPMIIVQVRAVPAETVHGVYLRGHIDFKTTLLAAPARMHGVLGQTLYQKERYPVGDMQFHGEGSPEDYEVSHVLGEDFVYTQYAAVRGERYGRVALASSAYERLEEPLTAGTSAATLALP